MAAVLWHYLIFRPSASASLTSIHSNMDSVWPPHSSRTQKKNGSERPSATIPPHYPPHWKAPWDNDGGAPKWLGGQEEAGLIMVAMAAGGGEHQTGADVLPHSLCACPASLGNNLQRFSLETRRRGKKREHCVWADDGEEYFCIGSSWSNYWQFHHLWIHELYWNPFVPLPHRRQNRV